MFECPLSRDLCSAPYHPNDKTNPLNFYGKTKLAGEQAIIKARESQGGAKLSVLRVPVLCVADRAFWLHDD